MVPKAVCDIISKDPMSPYIQYNMPASVARSVVATIEMLNIADTFRQLGSHDKVDQWGNPEEAVNCRPSWFSVDVPF